MNGRVVEDQYYLDGKDHSSSASLEIVESESVVESNTIVRPTAITESQSSSSSSSNNNNMVSIQVPEQFKNPVKCNLCRPGQIGINAEIPLNGGVAKCIEIYEYYLQNFLEGTKQCIAAQNWLNEICCGDKSEMNADPSSSTTTSTTTTTTATTTSAMVRTNPPTRKPISLNPTPRPTPWPTSKPVTDSQDDPSLASIYSEVNVVQNCAAAYDGNGGSYTIHDRVSHSGGNYVCMMSNWCSQVDFEPRTGQYWMVVWEYEGPCKEDATRPPRPTDPETESARPLVLQKEEGTLIQDGEQPPPPPPPPIEEETDESDPNEIVESIPEPLAPAEIENDESSALIDSDEPQCPPSWKLDYSYVEGDTVQAKGQIYTCKAFPYDGKSIQKSSSPRM